MATKTGPRLSEAERNAPDLDDDGRFDVERFPVPTSDGIEGPELKAAWDEAIRILDQAGDADEEQGGDEDDPEPDDEPGPDDSEHLT